MADDNKPPLDEFLDAWMDARDDDEETFQTAAEVMLAHYSGAEISMRLLERHHADVASVWIARLVEADRASGGSRPRKAP